jgi:hypothetical protein
MKTRREKMEGLERRVKLGLKVALLLAQLGDVSLLGRMIVLSELAVRQGENLVRGVYGVKEKN